MIPKKIPASHPYNLRIIGLLGGMSWQSTQTYYTHLNEAVQNRLGGLHSAPLILHSFDFAQIEALQASARWEEAGQILADAASKLEQAGAEAIMICTNTMHKLAKEIEQAISVPLLHIADATANAIIKSRSSAPLLLATAFTMEQDFYTARLASRLTAHNKTIFIPQAKHRAQIHDIIYNELCKGVINTESKKAYIDIIKKEAEAQGCDSVIFGCTEINLLIGPEDFAPKDSPNDAPKDGQKDWGLEVFDTTALHCTMGFEFMCRDRTLAKFSQTA